MTGQRRSLSVRNAQRRRWCRTSRVTCLTFLLKELPLRDTARAVDRADSTAPTAMPAVRDSAQEMERALLTLFGRERRSEVYQGLAAAAGVHVSPRGCWLLYRVADDGPITEAALARLLGITVEDLDDRLAELRAAGGRERHVCVIPAAVSAGEIGRAHV